LEKFIEVIEKDLNFNVESEIKKIKENNKSMLSSPPSSAREFSKEDVDKF
jgi:hypothetical protein